MPDVFSRWTIVSRSEGVEGIANAIDIVEKLADLAPPGFCAGERVVCNEIQTPRYVSLKMQREGVVMGTIVGAKKGDVRKTVAAGAGERGLEHVGSGQDACGVVGGLKRGGRVRGVGGGVHAVAQPKT